MPKGKASELRWSTKVSLKALERIAARRGLTQGEKRAVERAAVALIAVDSNERLERILRKFVRGAGKPLSLAQREKLESMGIDIREVAPSNSPPRKTR